jgi:hypothetical protein
MSKKRRGTIANPAGTETKPTFEEVMSAGTAYAFAGRSEERLPEGTSAFRTTQDDVDRVIDDVNARCGLTLRGSPAVLERLRARLPFVVGQIWMSESVPSRADTEIRLKRIRAAMQSAIPDLLGAIQGEPHESRDLDFTMFFARVLRSAHPELKPSEAFDHLERWLTSLQELLFYSDLALQTLGELPARKGRPKLEWFDQYVELMTEIAGHLGIEFRTMGKLEHDPHQTPFTAVVYGFETLLPEEVRSDTRHLRTTHPAQPQAA